MANHVKLAVSLSSDRHLGCFCRVAIVTALVGGIGAPFVLAFGANPAVVGVLALTCGYCGTLLTPMAANFNIVPVALLEMKDCMGVIRNQILPALVMISVQIVYMLIAS